MSGLEVDARRADVVDALRSGFAAQRGVPVTLESIVRAYGRAMRESGRAIGQTLVEVKDLLRAHTGHDEPIFTPKVIGWAIAGFFDGVGREDGGSTTSPR